MTETADIVDQIEKKETKMGSDIIKISHFIARKKKQIDCILPLC